VSKSARLAKRAAVKPSLSPSPLSIQEPAKSGDVFGWAIPVYLLLLSGGFAFLRSRLATMRGNELSIDRAVFTAINAVTLTGFQQTIGLDELRVPGQIGVFFLMAAGTALSLIIGGHLVARIAGLSISNRLIYLVAGGAIAVSALFGAAALGDTPLHGAFLGVSALGNSGLFIGKLPASEDLSTAMVLLPLAVAGGLGLVVWLELWSSLIKRQTLSSHSLISLSMYGGAYIVGLGLLTTQLQSSPSTAEALSTCSTSAITARSAGFPISSIGDFSRAGQWILAALMIFGPASGGTGGGVKGTTIYALCRSLLGSYRGERSGRSLPIAAAWLAAYALLVFVGSLFLLNLAPQMPGDRVLFLAISAASNVGWSHDPVSLVKSGLATLSTIMLLGRALPMAILWWMARSAPDADVAVG
jgi:trk system potassium uptake protein TrkH